MKKLLNNLQDLNFKKILLISLSFGILNLLIISIAHFIVPYLGFFPYKEILPSYHLPYFLNSLASFDGVQYLIIAREGYYTYNQAFFPLYPIIIKILSVPIFQNYLFSGILTSAIFFVSGLFLLSTYLTTVVDDKKKTIMVILFLLLFPTSFFFQAVYTESLFLFLSIGFLYFFKKEKFLISFIFGLLSSLTRLSGIFLILPVIGIFIDKYKNKKNFRAWSAILSPLIGLLMYSTYLFITTHDPLFFYSSQPAFGANRSTHLIILPQVLFRYVKIFVTSAFNFQYFISGVEFFFFILVFVVLLVNLYKLCRSSKKNFELIGLSLFSIVVVTLPTLTGTLSSVPRYCLFAISFFIAIANIKNTYFKIFLVILFVIFHIILLAFFSQGYFVS